MAYMCEIGGKENFSMRKIDSGYDNRAQNIKAVFQKSRGHEV